MTPSPRFLPCACLALLTLAACQTNRSGLPTATSSKDAGTTRDTGIRDGAVPPPPRADSGQSVADAASVVDGSTMPDTLVPPPRVDAGLPDAPIPPPPDAQIVDARVVVDTTGLPPIPDAAQDRVLVPPDASPADLAVVPVDTRQPDTRQPDARQPDTRRPDTNSVPAPVYDWPINSTDTLGGNPITVEGAPTVAPADPYGNVVCFNGTDDGITVDQNPIARLNAFTLQLLMRPDFTASAAPRVLDIIASNNSLRRLTVDLQSNRNGAYYAIATLTWDSESIVLEDTAATHASNEWIWLSITYDGTTGRLFMNGVEEADAALTGFGPMSANGTLSLGMRQSIRSFFPGCLARLIVSGTALSAGDLQRLP